MKSIYARASLRRFRQAVCVVLCLALAGMTFEPSLAPDHASQFIPTANANSVYFNLASGNLSFSITPSTTNQITSNDNWTGVASVEGYFGQNLTATHGVDPQTVLGTEFPSNQLPSSPTNVAANKGNPSAFNAGGLAEFDSGTYLAIGMQGNVQANPYIVFYVNTLGRGNITINYEIQDIDAGSNNSVSSVALQYRVGQTGLFTNLPAGYIADVTTGGVATAPQTKSVTLPAAADNQSQVQIRLITTNAASSSGSSTPDEWIGVNNVLISSLAPSAAHVDVSGRAVTPDGYGVSGAQVTVWSNTGNSRTVTTSPFGYFLFDDIEAGETYIFEVSSKRYSFANPTLTRTIHDTVQDIEFVTEGSPPPILIAPRRSGRGSREFQ